MFTNASGSLGPDDPDSDPDHSQNLITCSLSHFGHILKILLKSVHKFLSYLVHKQSNRQTDGQTNPGEIITSLVEVNIHKITLTKGRKALYYTIVSAIFELMCKINLGLRPSVHPY